MAALPSTSAQQRKLFLYCPDSVTAETVSMFRGKGYDCVALTADPADFWKAVGSLSKDDVLVLYSHGDTSGPLMVKGQAGSDMTDEEIAKLAAILSHYDVPFYLLSCNTGGGSFFEKLSSVRGVNAIAPKGYALVGATSEFLKITSVKSINDHSTGPGWATSGNIRTPRAATSMSVP
ncbi:MAG: hypothetical protein AAGD13_24465 [Pseudomonadota bacterium]